MTRSARWPILTLVGLVGLAIASGACGQGSATPTPEAFSTPVPTASATPPPTATPYSTPTNLPPASDRPVPLPLPTMTSRYFAGSGVCSSCHTDQSDSAGNDVSIDRQWAVSSMANSARNPFWQAALSAETGTVPEQSQNIQAFCSTCHMPMAKYMSNVFSTPAKVLGDGFLNSKNPLHDLAMDGVSCSLCHQIGQNGLGTEDSFSGGFVIDAEAPPGSRPAFGPYQTSSDLADQMTRQSGFVPIMSDHMGRSEVCATCHELVLELDGTPTQSSPLALQTTYSEWLESDVRYSSSCQDCHMPEVVSGAYVATQSQQPRSPFRQHSFLGGNANLLALFARFGSELGVGYLEEAIPDAQAKQALFMQTQTANISLASIRQVGGRLEITIEVQVKTGHKFPTGFPSRRAWLHLTVQDASGATVFESGAVSSDGRIVGDDMDGGTGAFEPHYRIIDNADKVQVYEAVLGTTAGRATTSLTEAARWLKDNRLLPPGFDIQTAGESTGVVGRAAGDGDFEAGGDTVQYNAAIAGSQAPYKVTAELLYQGISPAWIDALRSVSTAEAERYVGYMDDVQPKTLLVSSAEATFSP